MNVPCQRCRCPLESGDLRCVICGGLAPHTGGANERVIASVLRCDTCGAAVAYDEKAGAPRCVFCASVMRVETPEDPLEVADAFVPFDVSRGEASGALRRFLGSRGFFAPSDLASKAAIEAMTPIYFASWVCEADALISYTADTNAGAMRSSWAPVAGQHALAIRDLVVSASRGLSEHEVAALAPHFRYDRSVASPTEAGATLEHYDVQRSRARDIVVRGIEKQSETTVRTWLPGSSYRLLKLAVLLQGVQTRRMALPAYVLAYRYGDTLYRAVVHGQNASCVIGKAPVSPWKVLAVIAAALALAFVLLFALSR